MRYIVIITICLLLPLSVFADIDERKIDVYFANGINTKLNGIGGAIYNTTEVLEPAIRREFYHNEEEMKKSIGKITYAYNQTSGPVLDIWESIAQKLNFQALIDALFDTTHGPDLQGQIDKYSQSILDGHRVLVVAHSQGNLFTGEAYEALDGWMQDYFFAVSVASPRLFKIKSNTPHIAFDNDIVPYLGGVFIPTGNPNGEAGSIESHAFTYYMGYPSEKSHVSTNVAKIKIMKAISGGYTTLNQVMSQWNIKQIVGCGCDKKVLLSHIESTANLDHLVEGSNPLIFEKTGKLYQVYDETNTTLHWVKADIHGTAVKNEQNHLPNACYSLTGTDEIIKGSINPAPTDGLLRVVLDWDKKDIDLNLGINGPTAGVKEEHPEYECPRENWYIANESGLAAGDYFVSVTTPSSVDQALMPENVRIDVKAMGKGEYIGIDINDSALLSLGEVYKIHVDVPVQGSGSVSSSINRVTAVPVSTTVPYREDNEGTIYSADLFLLLKQVAMGPVAGASLLLEKLNNGEWLELYTGVTTSGATINSNGLIIFPTSLQESALESDILLLTASGGQDVDADDDLNMDETPTAVFGKLHAFIDAENVVGNTFKVNILTEIAYQVVRNRFDENTTKEALFTMLDDVSKLLIANDLNDDNVITYKDTTTWLASFDKDKLQFDYNEKIEPIVQKIYSGEDIYLDVYKLLYAGKISSINIDTNDTDTIRISLNNMADISQLAKEDFILKDSHSNIVDFIFESTNKDFIFYPSTELIGGDEYTIEFAIEIIDDHGNIFLDTHFHKFRIPEWIPPIIPETTIHIAENSLFVPINVIDSSAPLKYTIIGGVDKDRFKLNNDEDKLYFKNTPDFEEPIDSNIDNTYELDIRIADSFLNATTQSVQIIVDDVIERPTVKSRYFTIDENASSGTIIGSLELSAIGSPITSIVLSGDGHENFLVDSNGIIAVSSMANLDYAIKTKYTLQVQVTNAQGFSDSAEITIYITVGKPILLGNYTPPNYAYDMTISSDENIAYIADVFSGLQIVDISTPQEPSILGSYKLNDRTQTVILSADNDIAYVGNYTNGLYILNVSDPTTPVMLGYCQLPSWTTYKMVLSPDENFLYVTGQNGLKVIDVSDLSIPSIAGSYGDGSYWSSAYSLALPIDGQTLYLGSARFGVYLLDVSDPKTPKWIKQVLPNTSITDIVLTSDPNKVYAINGSGLHIIDVSVPRYPAVLGSFNISNASRLTIPEDESKAYVVGNEIGLHIVDISTPTSPFLLGAYDIQGIMNNVAISSDGRTLFTSDYDGLQINSISSLSY
ncbi:MAG: hypothetical protein WBG65_10100 [Sulfurimonadaceae bacterium]